MKKYNELLESKPGKQIVVEGYTLDIVATFKKDSKEGPITIYKDEQAEIYCVKNGWNDKGVFFTAKQWKEMKNAMSLYEKL